MKEQIMSTEISIRVFTQRVAADTEAQLMRASGFTVPQVSTATVAANWSNSTTNPSVKDDAICPCWVVIGRR